MTRDARAVCAAIDARLSRRLGAPVTTGDALAKVLAKFLLDRALYRRLLAKHRPTRVYCVVAYAGLAPLIAAAREAGIASIELQHGVISRYHLGYSYPDQDYAQLAYFPDQLYGWGDPWDELMDVPVPRARLVPYGFRYFEHRAGAYRTTEKRPRHVLVISQGTIGRDLAREVLRLSPALAHCTVSYKLHPSEKARWREYPALVELAKLPNVTIVEDGNLYALMAECEWQIGVYSTALYEGRALGLKTALADLPGVEYMDRWFERGAAIKLSELSHVLAGSRI